MFLRRLTASSAFLNRTLLKNVYQTDSFSALRKPLKHNLIEVMPSRNFVKVKIVKPEDNQNKKPFALIKQEPFFLPNNPFKMMFDVFKRGLMIKFEMAKIDPTFKTSDFLNGTRMVCYCLTRKTAQ